MPDRDDAHRPHFILTGVTSTEEYIPVAGGGKRSAVPARGRAGHGATLLRQIDDLKPQLAQIRGEQLAAGLEGGFGLQVEFESFPEIELAFESLARERLGIELLNVRHDGNTTSAAVFVPEGQLEHFERLIADYLAEKKDVLGRPRDNRRLLDAISTIRAATLRELWTDDPAVLPKRDDERIWWEIWLPVRGDRASLVKRYRDLAALQKLTVPEGELEFPERTVLLTHASVGELKNSMMTLNCIAEIRRAKETADFIDSLSVTEQSEWVADLLARTEFAGDEAMGPSVCVLDTGVNNGHDLLGPALRGEDCHTIEPAWGVDDQHGHGTQMAGLSLYGDLFDVTASSSPVSIRHRLESVKLLPRDNWNGNDARHHGLLTMEAVARPEITAPLRRRVYGMAVSSRDGRDRGRPSAWSSTLDALACDFAGDGAHPRLFAVCAGNISEIADWAQYPNSNSTDSIHDPGQSWNAITVGAFTELVDIAEENTGAFTPVASAGGLSPFSTTSSTWQPRWPLKPDVVFEGGNVARDAVSPVAMSSLSLLTTHHLPEERLFTTANATSAATALASRMAAQLIAAYPALWPETVRALMVHSAEWTDEMRGMYLTNLGRPSKADVRNLIRHCGFGVPDLETASWSVSNSLSMVVQQELQPFEIGSSSLARARELHVHSLPWPVQSLADLGETEVEMRVTLSYFVEPNPGDRDVRSRYRYQSHGLRFDVKRPTEPDDEFRKRINRAARDEEEGTFAGSDDPNWIVGSQNRHRGSIHSDTWRGTAIDLASRGTIAVYPTLGWWKTRTALGRVDKRARYALVVSIRAPEVEVDLYTAIANQIATSITIET